MWNHSSGVAPCATSAATSARSAGPQRRPQRRWSAHVIPTRSRPAQAARSERHTIPEAHGRTRVPLPVAHPTFRSDGRIRTLAVSCIAVTAALAAFVPRAPAQCVGVCPFGGTLENDACGGIVPDPNGGCPAGPEQHQPLGVVLPAAAVSVCGSIGASIEVAIDGGAGKIVDRDAFTFQITVASKVRFGLFQHDETGEPVPDFTLDVLEGVECGAQATRYAASFGLCPFLSDPVALPPGDHVVVLSLGGRTPAPCPVSYRLTIEIIQELPVECGRLAGSCCVARAVGGCNDVECCEAVCILDFACCDLAWDAICVIYAVDSCGLCDCNNNALLDPLEIQSGASLDCNRNAVPDECELDCNGNGTADACDIALDPSLDTDSNGSIDACQCGCLDLVIVADTTGSMDGAISNVKNALAQVLSAALAAGNDDLRVALVTFTDKVTVVRTLTDDTASVQSAVLALGTGGGMSSPEASDEALREVISGGTGCLASGSQFFHEPFRTNCRTLAVLVTDARPGGCDDAFTPGIDDLNALERAFDAADLGIEIAAVCVPVIGIDSVLVAIMESYALVTGGTFLLVDPDGGGTANALISAVLACSGRFCLGDLDQTGTVDGADLGLMLQQWGAPNSTADLDDDGAVNGADLGILLAAWGECGSGRRLR